MIARLVPVASLLAMLAGCSDPLDDEPKGQTIPTRADLTTRYAAGAGPDAGGSNAQAGGGIPVMNGGSDGDRSSMGPGAPMQAKGGGLVSQAGAGGGAGTGGGVPPAGLQTAPGGQGEGGGQSGASGQGGTSGASGGAAGG